MKIIPHVWGITFFQRGLHYDVSIFLANFEKQEMEQIIPTQRTTHMYGSHARFTH